MTDAAKKADQGRRRRASFEVFSLTVFKPKLIAWLVREGLLKDVDRWDRGKITAALEAHLSAQYDLPDVPGEAQPRYAAGSFGREFTTLRDRPHHDVGLLEREGVGWNLRRSPTRYLITKRAAALRRAISPPESPILLAAFPPGALMGEDLDEPAAPAADDYDPQDDAEEVSADMMDDALADAFDADGYEKD